MSEPIKKCPKCDEPLAWSGDYPCGHDVPFQTKAEAILKAIRDTEVGSDIIIHNEDMSVFCILTVKCKEHPENLDEDGGKVLP